MCRVCFSCYWNDAGDLESAHGTNRTAGCLYRQKNGRTYLPLSMEPTGSRFVVFRKGATQVSVAAIKRNGRDIMPAQREVCEESPAIEATVTDDDSIELLIRKPGAIRTGYGVGRSLCCAGVSGYCRAVGKFDFSLIVALPRRSNSTNSSICQLTAILE